jgi:hypothetical protein
MSGAEKQLKGAANPDRVWLTLKRSYRVAEYESLTVELGAASSAEPGETTRGTVQRVFGDLKEEFADVLAVMREAEKI